MTVVQRLAAASAGLDIDPERDAVFLSMVDVDPDGLRSARVIRSTYDQIYDGQHTGRFRWEQLFKTEKTHFGTLLEINLRREFDDVINDGVILDYQVSGIEVDCKWSQTMGGWMLPPECFGHLLLVATASDQRGTWSLGVVRASDENRRPSANRDAKTGLNARGRHQIAWLWHDQPLQPNILLSLNQDQLAAIMAHSSGQGRVNELLRQVTGRPIGRNAIATLGQQADYMARIRDNGHGARTKLRREGYLIPGGDYQAHREVARALGAPVPGPGEIISIRVAPSSPDSPGSVLIDSRWWRLADSDEQIVVEAPKLPETRKRH